MKTFLSLLLDKRRKKKDGSYPIIFRLTHHRKTTSLASGFSVHPYYWDERKSEIKPSWPGSWNVSRVNNLLLKEKARMVDILNKLYDRGELNYMSINQVKERISRKKNFDSFLAFGEEKVEELKASQRYGTALTYKCLVGILRVFSKGKDIRFNEINYDFLKKFEQFHLSKEGNTLNGVASYMRTLKAIYNKGIKEGYIEREAYPFYHYKIRMTPTAKRALPADGLKKIMELKVEKGSKLFHYRNYFLISYMLYGMSFVDMCFLKLENIVAGRVQLQRKKTGKIYNIKITESLQELLDFYIQGKSREDFILPVIQREKLEDQYKDIDWERHRYNKGLKEIAKLCKIEHRLTTYVSRHSFATQAMLKNIPLQAISAMLGHSKLNTTQIYLKSLPTDILDDYNEKLIASI
ncbi:MAG: site-specific integrase [Flavobacteriaceae bacterium]